MFDDIILSKITAPKLHDKIMLRKRIKEILTGKYAKIWSIVAGPGYGKTTVLRELKKYLNIPTAWYCPDENDNDFVVFIKYLIRSIQLIYPSYGEIINDIIQSDSSADIKILFLNELIKSDKEILIIIDNYHKIENNTKINEFIQFLIDYIPPNIYLAVSSRQMLPFNLTKVANIGQVINIKTKDIKLNMQESRDLLSHSIEGLNFSSNITEVLKFIDGWILGLLLLIENLRKFSDKDNLDINYFNNLTHNTINDYFTSEIMNSFPKEIKEFLFFTSIPESFDSDMCQNVFNLPPDKLIKYLENNPFIEDYCIQDKIFYKYHDLFRQFLLQESQKIYSCDEIKKTHADIGDYYTHKELFTSAINQYLISGDYKKALHLLKKVAEKFWELEIILIKKWLEQFPEIMTVKEPILLTIKARLAYEGGNIEEAINFCKQAEKIYRENNEITDLIITISNLIHLSSINNNIEESRYYLSIAKSYQDHMSLKYQLNFLLKYSRIINDTEEAIKNLKEIESLSRSSDDIVVNIERWSALYLLGMEYAQIGEVNEAIVYLNKALNEIKNEDKYFFKSSLALLYFYKGDIESALNLIKECDIESALKLIKEDERKMYVFLDPKKVIINLLNLIRCMLIFDDENIPQVKYYIQKVRHYIQQYIRIKNFNARYLISLKNLSAIIARKENNFPYAVKLHKETITETLNVLSDESVLYTYIIEYLRTLLISSDLTEIIETANEYLNQNIFHYTYQKLEIRLYLCTAYLKYGKNEMTDKGIKLIKLILEDLPDNEHLLLMNPLITETLLPEIFQINETKGIYLWEKALEIYKCNIKPYIINTIMPLIPPQIFYRNEDFIKKLETSIPDMPLFLITAFGNLELKIGTKTVQWERQQVKKLFALLLLYPGGITQDKLIEEILPDNKNAESNLSKLIYKLRKFLEPEIQSVKDSKFIIYENGKYKLNLENSYYIFDVKEFLEHYEKGNKSLKSNNKEITCIEYEKGVNFYQGELLEDLNLLNLEPLKEDYRRKCISMLLFLIKYTYTNELWDECIFYCNKILNINKYEEQAYCYLMKCYSKKHWKDLVKKTYDSCKHIMKKDLKLDISESTDQLYKELLTK